MIRPAEVARRLGISRQAVHEAITRGTMRSVVRYGVRLVDESEVERYKKQKARTPVTSERPQ